ncbi:MAG: AAA family ATPase [Planctomycetes bacterium]|nr:AAA family ATPase [Planctomycetota bacterium]
MNRPFLKCIEIKNLLSFGPDSAPVELGSLNVLIGPNGSGKSNFFDILNLLRSSTGQFVRPMHSCGGIENWFWKGKKDPEALIRVVVENPDDRNTLIAHEIEFLNRRDKWIEITRESINEVVRAESDPFLPVTRRTDPVASLYVNENNEALLSAGGDTNGQREFRQLKAGEFQTHESILSQIKDPKLYPELMYLIGEYEKIRIFNDWHISRNSKVRRSSAHDISGGFLLESCENLALVLNRFPRNEKRELLDALSALYQGIEDYRTDIKAGTVELLVDEEKWSIPASMLSDGTIRYLCLLAILCHLDPPPVVCIEEPELGLHPDVLPGLVRLMKKASERCQLIVTTHSDIIVDALTDTPESVIVCEKENSQTQMRRLKKEDLEVWLEKYRLGEYWLRGGIGGTRY